MRVLAVISTGPTIPIGICASPMNCSTFPGSIAGSNEDCVTCWSVTPVRCLRTRGAAGSARACNRSADPEGPCRAPFACSLLLSYSGADHYAVDEVGVESVEGGVEERFAERCGLVEVVLSRDCLACA